MPADFFELSAEERKGAFDVAGDQSGRPPQLFEKDVWVVWTLRALFESPLAADLTFKGGTSLSKVYQVIDRFSEDIDLTYDIRKLLPMSIATNGMPPNHSQSGKWSELARKLLPEWVEKSVAPILQAALDQNPAAKGGSIELQGDKLYLHYPYLTDGIDYVKPAVLLEFGGRATGEPNQTMPVQCDIAEHLPGGRVTLPTVSVVVMDIARTFWEKATAAHVYCLQGNFRGGERYARHWFDLAAIGNSEHFVRIQADKSVAHAVAEHKGWFFREKAADQKVIDYGQAVNGNLQIVPEGAALSALEQDYSKMLDSGLLFNGAMSFEDVMTACARLESLVNGKAWEAPPEEVNWATSAPSLRA